MAQVIHKYAIETLCDVQHIKMHVGAKLLNMQMQNAYLNVWAVVDTDAPIETFEVRTVLTGAPCSGIEYFNYLGTYQAREGSFVGHVFLSQIGH